MNNTRKQRKIYEEAAKLQINEETIEYKVIATSLSSNRLRELGSSKEISSEHWHLRDFNCSRAKSNEEK